MLSYEQALQSILENTRSLSEQVLTLDQLLGHFLAEPLNAKFDLPMFDNSAVDGYGVLIRDVQNASSSSPVRLQLAGTVSAGDSGSHGISSGSALKIMTGAMVPPACEAVIMREVCQEQDGFVMVGGSAIDGENIRRKGDEIRVKDKVISEGTFITPPVIGLIATLGYANAKVTRKPRVAVVSTGDELIEPGKPLVIGQIYDSNTYALTAAVQAMGLEASGTFHAKDDVEATRKSFAEALSVSDVVVSAGGVSVGDFDYVKGVFEDLGVETIFWRIAVKPGKPVYFGVFERDGNHKLVFGLPGNPVSALVTFHQFVRPALVKMMGGAVDSNFCAQTGLQAAISKPLKKKPGRLDFVRGTLTVQGNVLSATPTTGQESHMLSGLAAANCLIHFAADDSQAEAGSLIPVDWLSWFPNNL